MPTSFPSSIPTIIKLMQQVDPKRVLDIGIGMGKYGVLAREYCPKLELLDGIEAYEPYMSYQWGIYDHIELGDARNSTAKPYDLVLLIDIIEHLSHEDAKAMLARYSDATIIVSTPIEDYRAHYDNHYEDHIAHYPITWFDNAQDHSTTEATIVLIPPV